MTIKGNLNIGRDLVSLGNWLVTQDMISLNTAKFRTLSDTLLAHDKHTMDAPIPLLLFVFRDSSCLSRRLQKAVLPPGDSADPEEPPTCFLPLGPSVGLSGGAQLHFPTVQQALISGLQAGRPSGKKDGEEGRALFR